MNYAISTYSAHPDEAFDAAMCMRNPENQLMAAIDAGTAPVLRSRVRPADVKPWSE